MRVGGDDRVADAGQSRGPALFALAQLLLDGMLGHGQFDVDAEVAFLERLEEIALGLGLFGELESFFIGVGGQIDDGNVEAFADLIGRLDAVEPALQTNVHQHQVRVRLLRNLHRLLAGGHGADYGVAHLGQPFTQIFGHDAFIFDHENAYAVHDLIPHRRCDDPRRPG